MQRIDDESFIPKYVRLKRQLVEDIENRVLVPGDQFPSRNQIMRDFRVSETTARRVMSELENEGYVYTIQGRGTFIAEKKLKPVNVALLIPTICWDSKFSRGGCAEIGARLTQAIEAEVRQHGGNFMLVLNTNDVDVERSNILSIPDRNIDAVVLFHIGGSRNVDCIADVARSGIPVVMIDRAIEGLQLDSVATDNHIGAYQAVRCLAERGFRRIYHLTFDADWSSVKERASGYSDAAAEYGLPCDIVTVGDSSMSVEDHEERAYALTERMISMHPHDEPFAVFALNPPLMVGAWRAIEKAGLAYDKFALAGFDEPYVYLPQGVLRVVVLQPLDEIGRRCAQIAISRLRGEDSEPACLRLPPEIVVLGDPNTRAC